MNGPRHGLRSPRQRAVMESEQQRGDPLIETEMTSDPTRPPLAAVP